MPIGCERVSTHFGKSGMLWASCGSGGSGVGLMSLKRGQFLERPSSYWSKKAVFDVIMKFKPSNIMKRARHFLNLCPHLYRGNLQHLRVTGAISCNYKDSVNVLLCINVAARR